MHRWGNAILSTGYVTGQQQPIAYIHFTFIHSTYFDSSCIVLATAVFRFYEMRNVYVTWGNCFGVNDVYECNENIQISVRSRLINNKIPFWKQTIQKTCKSTYFIHYIVLRTNHDEQELTQTQVSFHRFCCFSSVYMILLLFWSRQQCKATGDGYASEADPTLSPTPISFPAVDLQADPCFMVEQWEDQKPSCCLQSRSHASSHCFLPLQVQRKNTFLGKLESLFPL